MTPDQPAILLEYVGLRRGSRWLLREVTWRVPREVLVLCEGRSVGQGVPGEVLTEGVLSRAYGCPVGVRRSNGRFYVEVNPGAWGSLMTGRNGR